MEKPPYDYAALKEAVAHESRQIEGFEAGIRAERVRRREYDDLLAAGVGAFDWDAVETERAHIDVNIDNIEDALAKAEERRRRYKRWVKQHEDYRAAQLERQRIDREISQRLVD